MESPFRSRLRQLLVDRLYTESLLLADEARSYFDDLGRPERDRLPLIVRVSYTREALKVTTRLMHSIAWLLTQRAISSGNLPEYVALDPSRRLAVTLTSDAYVLVGFPATALALVRASENLHRRVALLDDAQVLSAPLPSQVRLIRSRLFKAFQSDAVCGEGVFCPSHEQNELAPVQSVPIERVE